MGHAPVYNAVLVENTLTSLQMCTVVLLGVLYQAANKG